MSDKKQPEKFPKSAPELKADVVPPDSGVAADARKIAEATFARYMSWVTPIRGQYALRGLANAKWGLTASAYRRLMRNLDPAPELVDGLFSGYLHELVDDARECHSAGLEGLSDLNVMARLQHHGAATGLIDFTDDPRVALWAACQSERDEKTGEETPGNVFAVPLDNKNIHGISEEQVANGKLKDFFSACSDCFGRLWFWRPVDVDVSRMSAQQSVLVFGRPKIEGDFVISMPDAIPAEAKKGILEILEKQNFSEQGLFPDFPGFAMANGRDRDFSVRGGGRYQGRADSIEKECRETRNATAPSDPHIHVLRGVFKFGQGDLQGALSDYARAIELNPQDAAAYNNRGNVYGSMGRHEEALSDYARAIELNPQNAAVYNNRGNVYAHMGRREEALSDYARAIELNPQDAGAYNNRGNVYDNMGRHEEALSDCARAIELEPKNAAVYNNRGNVYAHMGRREEALSDYARAIELNPQDAGAYNNRGNVYDNMGRHEEALSDYARAIELNPQDAAAYNNRGNVYAHMGRHEEALSDYARAIELNPQDAGAHNHRGNALYLSERLEEACAAWKEAKRLAELSGDMEVVEIASGNLAEHCK